MGVIVPTVRIYDRRLFVALEEQLPGIFVSSSEEPSQGLVLRQKEFPEREASALVGENPANQHHLDHIDELDVFIHHALNARLQCYRLI